MDENKKQLLQIFFQRAFQRGNFVLASGAISSYYIDSKKALFNSQAIDLLGTVMFEVAKALRPNAIGGLEVGAIPLTAAVLGKFHQSGISLEGFFVRKKVKDHGSKQRIEGQVKAGDRVVILDDVLTTGGSAMEAFDEVEKAGATVAGVICIVDRLQGAKELFQKKCPFHSIFTIDDFLNYPS